MPKKRPRPLAERVSERAHGNCSPAYLWLRTRYRGLRIRMDVRFPPWDEVAAEMRAEGVLGGRGRPVTGETVRRIWPRVCGDVEADGKRRAPRQKRAEPGWKPTSFAPTAPKVSTPEVAARRDAPIAAPPADDPDGTLERLRRWANERSGRKGSE